MRYQYEHNLVNEANTIATMLIWSNTKNDPAVQKLTDLIHELTGVIEEQLYAIEDYNERVETLERKLYEAEKTANAEEQG